jgi:NAD kinase
MSRALPPRAVVVTRPTEYESLLWRHGSRDQAKFFLQTRGQKIEDVMERHRVQEVAMHAVLTAIPQVWRRAKVSRADLDRFLFEPEDVVIAVGQDGLVANVAKYVRGQPVIGVNPSKQLYDGVLVRHPPQAVADLLAMSQRSTLKIEKRTMVRASLADGQELVALNEIYVGHRTHQSSRYRIEWRGTEERHSSSGLIVCTGTGSTGWAKSVSIRREGCPPLPSPAEPDLAFLVREAWPSVVTGTSLVHGRLTPGMPLVVTSEMNDGGVAFGDGIEEDRLELPYGQVVTLSQAPQELCLC